MADALPVICSASGHLINYFMLHYLPNREGEVLGDGDDVVHDWDDLEKLMPYDPGKDMMLAGGIQTTKVMREAEPDEPLYAIMMPATGNAFSLLGATPGFRTMVKRPDFFCALSELLEDATVEAGKRLWDSGVDFLWIPMPNFGGYCISRKTCEKCITASNERVNKQLRDYGARIVIHTCGLYDDRFDLVLNEHGNAWHISDTKTKKVKEKYGERISLMGNIPCCSVLMEGTQEDVYNYVYSDCLDGAQDGRFILSGDCDISPLTPDENLIAAVHAAKDAEKKLFG